MIKTVAKECGNILSLIVASAPAGAFVALAGLAGASRAFPGSSQLMGLVPGISGAYLRRAFYRLTSLRCGRDAWLSFGVVFSHQSVSIGDKVYIGVYSVIGDVTLEDDVLIGSHVSIMNGSKQHGIERLDIPVREQPGEWPRITIGKDSWIGDRAVVMANVGKHCVVGAGAVVTKPVPDYAIVVGNPAKIVRYRNEWEQQVNGNQLSADQSTHNANETESTL